MSCENRTGVVLNESVPDPLLLVDCGTGTYAVMVTSQRMPVKAFGRRGEPRSGGGNIHSFHQNTPKLQAEIGNFSAHATEKRATGSLARLSRNYQEPTTDYLIARIGDTGTAVTKRERGDTELPNSPVLSALPYLDSATFSTWSTPCNAFLVRNSFRKQHVRAFVARTHSHPPLAKCNESGSPCEQRSFAASRGRRASKVALSNGSLFSLSVPSGDPWLQIILLSREENY